MDVLWVVGEPLLTKILRPILVYAFLVVALRLAGKRELAQMNPFDLVVLLMLANIVQNASIGNDNSLVGGLIGATVLLLTNYLVTTYLFRHPKVEETLEGNPTILIHQGRMLKDNLTRERMSEADLRAAIHRQGFERVEDVQLALLELSGNITVFGKRPTPEERLGAELNARLDRIETGLNRLIPAGESAAKGV